MDELIQAAQEFNRKHDPCALRGGSCRVALKNPCCYNTRFKREDPNDLRCLYLGPHGCEHSNLECMIWFCATAICKMSPEQLQELKQLEDTAKRQGLIGPPYLGEHYVGADKNNFVK